MRVPVPPGLQIPVQGELDFGSTKEVLDWYDQSHLDCGSQSRGSWTSGLPRRYWTGTTSPTWTADPSPEGVGLRVYQGGTGLVRPVPPGLRIPVQGELDFGSTKEVLDWYDQSHLDCGSQSRGSWTSGLPRRYWTGTTSPTWTADPSPEGVGLRVYQGGTGLVRPVPPGLRIPVQGELDFGSTKEVLDWYDQSHLDCGSQSRGSWTSGLPRRYWTGTTSPTWTADPSPGGAGLRVYQGGTGLVRPVPPGLRIPVQRELDCGSTKEVLDWYDQSHLDCGSQSRGSWTAGLPRRYWTGTTSPTWTADPSPGGA